MRVFIDTNLWIYHLEAHPSFGSVVAAHLAALAVARDEVVVSDLVRLECRVGPLKSKNTTLLARYDGLFSRPDVEVVPLSPAVCDLAADLRADFGVKTPDALNIAAALTAKCTVFFTHDIKLQVCTRITVRTI